MVKTPEKYPWSSHSAYLGTSSVPWLTTDWVLSQFAGKKKSAIELYRQFVLKGMNEGQRNEFYQGNIDGEILGNDHFSEQALAAVSRKMAKKTTLDQVLQAVCKHYAIDPNDLSSRSKEKRISQPRAVVALLARDIEHLNLTALSRKLNRDLSGLSKAASRLEQRLKSDTLLVNKVTTLKNLFF